MSQENFFLFEYNFHEAFQRANKHFYCIKIFDNDFSVINQMTLK